MDDPQQTQDDDRNTSRLQLVLDVFVFQFKLAADGIRDLILSPLSIISALLGLVAGGDDPHRYFRDLLRLGRRSELWINLFGYRKHGGTSDELIAPIRERVVSEAKTNPWISRAGGKLNRKLDSVGDRLREPAPGAGEPASGDARPPESG
ncbi:MAG TPA: hypothetical protein VIS76_16185 [Pseudomonadales bacterium]